MSMFHGRLRCDACGAILDHTDAKLFAMIQVFDRVTGHPQSKHLCRNRVEGNAFTEGCESKVIDSGALRFYLDTVLAEEMDLTPQGWQQ
jgi:hypothetical protein